MTAIRMSTKDHPSIVVYYDGKFVRGYQEPTASYRNAPQVEIGGSRNYESDYYGYENSWVVDYSDVAYKLSIDGKVVKRCSELTQTSGRRYPNVMHYFLK